MEPKQQVKHMTEISEKEVRIIASELTHIKTTRRTRLLVVLVFLAGAIVAASGMLIKLHVDYIRVIGGMAIMSSPLLLFPFEKRARKAYVEHWKETGELYGEGWWYDIKSKAFTYQPDKKKGAADASKN